MLIRDFRQGRCLMARLDHGTDIIIQITDLAKEKEIKTGFLSVIGALSRAELGYYDQVSQKYGKIQIDEPVELVSCLGNVSLRRRSCLLCTLMPLYRTGRAGFMEAT